MRGRGLWAFALLTLDLALLVTINLLLILNR